MDVNARINWIPGLELTAQTFLTLGEHLDFRQQMALHAALGANRMGILPDSEFINAGCFVKNRFEMERFKCLAVLPSGKLIDVDEPVSIAIPMLYGNEYYLAVGLGSGQIEFEKDGVPFTRPQYEYTICPLEELEQADLMPVVRFHAENGVFSIEQDFIPPSLTLNADPRFQTWLTQYIEHIKNLIDHANLEDGEGKRALLRYLFLLKGVALTSSVHDFVRLIQEIVQAVDYYIATPHLDTPLAIELPTQRDIQKWLKWADDYFIGAASILDTVILEDNTIDYYALLEQAKKELYERLNPELYEKLLLQIKDELRTELSETISLNITNYIDNSLKPELERVLGIEIHDNLYQKLYPELYDNLYKALYVPEPEEKKFVPMI